MQTVALMLEKLRALSSIILLGRSSQAIAQSNWIRPHLL